MSNKPTEARYLRRARKRAAVTHRKDLLYKIYKNGNVVYTCVTRADALSFIHRQSPNGFAHAMENGWGIEVDGSLQFGER